MRKLTCLFFSIGCILGQGMSFAYDAEMFRDMDNIHAKMGTHRTYFGFNKSRVILTRPGGGCGSQWSRRCGSVYNRYGINDEQTYPRYNGEPVMLRNTRHPLH